jgi:two-component system cell cycle sensor histidine kinase/response regulator CckA
VARAGLRAVVAENGIAGLETFIDLRDEICLVLADIIMPVMSGIEMAEKLLQIDKHVKIVLMSGYSDSVIEMEGRNRFPFIRSRSYTRC